MKKNYERIKYWGQLLLLPLYWFSFLFPRNKKIWIFGSTFGRRFADNPRYFYLYISQHCKDIQAIWISHDKKIVEFLQKNGYEAYYYHSLKGIWFALRGKVYLFDNYSKDINFWQSGGAVKINMWHGVGNKKINYDNEYDKVRHPKNAWEKWKFFPRRLSDEKPGHYIVSTSPMMSEIFARAFQTSAEHVLEIGYPRNDILFDACEMKNLYLPEEEKLQEEIRKWKATGKKILLYAPTFRSSEKKFLEIMNIETFNQFLQKNNMVLICKLHPKSSCKEAFEAFTYSNIYNAGADVDINSFLKETDLLIADYSSVYSDYMLLDKPVVAFHYDYEEYANDTRAAYFDYEEYMPEKKAYTQEMLEEGIREVLKEDKAIEQRQKFRAKLYQDINEKSAERLTKEIRKMI